METIQGYFTDLNTENAQFGEHSLDKDRLTLNVQSGLALTEHHPISKEKSPIPMTCRLVFKGVTYAKRVHHGTGKEYFLGPFLGGHGATKEFKVEGKNADGRLRWEIEARSFSLEYDV